jgi:hypothetical protein
MSKMEKISDTKLAPHHLQYEPQIAMRPLAPKPASRRRAYSATSLRSRLHRPRNSPCNVPICPHDTCRLRSHQLYGSRSILPSTIERPIYDETQILGLEDVFERDLFHYCLSDMLEQKMSVYGPAYPMTYDVSEMRNLLVGAAVMSKHATLIIVSIAYCDVFHQSPGLAEQLDRMYDKLKVAMRQELDIEKLLMFVIAQSIMDRHRGRDVQPHRRILGEVARDRIHAPGYRCGMHRTQSLDYGIVMEGDIDMVLDSGEVHHMKKGDIAVQRATQHQWVNTSSTKWARMLFCLQDCKPLTVSGQEMKEDLGDAGLPASGN